VFIILIFILSFAAVGIISMSSYSCLSTVLCPSRKYVTRRQSSGLSRWGKILQKPYTRRENSAGGLRGARVFSRILSPPRQMPAVPTAEYLSYFCLVLAERQLQLGLSRYAVPCAECIRRVWGETHLRAFHRYVNLTVCGWRMFIGLCLTTSTIRGNLRITLAISN
jgi:hypothetical protein